MTELWAAIALLLCLTSGFILWAWLRPLPPSVVPDNRHHLVVDLYRIKQKELDQELEQERDLPDLVAAEGGCRQGSQRC